MTNQCFYLLRGTGRVLFQAKIEQNDSAHVVGITFIVFDGYEKIGQEKDLLISNRLYLCFEMVQNKNISGAIQSRYLKFIILVLGQQKLEKFPPTNFYRFFFLFCNIVEIELLLFVDFILKNVVEVATNKFIRRLLVIKLN